MLHDAVQGLPIRTGHSGFMCSILQRMAARLVWGMEGLIVKLDESCRGTSGVSCFVCPFDDDYHGACMVAFNIDFYPIIRINRIKFGGMCIVNPAAQR